MKLEEGCSAERQFQPKTLVEAEVVSKQGTDAVWLTSDLPVSPSAGCLQVGEKSLKLCD